jgi:hypothetical protein
MFRFTIIGADSTGKKLANIFSGIEAYSVAQGTGFFHV